MTKDSQPDHKSARMEKCNYQSPITSEEVKNNNRTNKKHSIKRKGFQSEHIN